MGKHWNSTVENNLGCVERGVGARKERAAATATGSCKTRASQWTAGRPWKWGWSMCLPYPRSRQEKAYLVLLEAPGVDENEIGEYIRSSRSFRCVSRCSASKLE